MTGKEGVRETMAETAGSPVKGPKKKGALLLNKVKKNTSLYILLLPSVIILFIFCYIPMYGVIIAFKDYNCHQPASSPSR